MITQNELAISLEYEPNDADTVYIANKLYHHNVKNGMPERTSCWIFARNEQNQLIGGCMFYLFDTFVYIDKLWVDDRYQGKGYGKKLVKTVENEARRRGCATAHLDTFSFQNAKAFYESCGYKVTSSNDAIAGRHTQYFMKKVLGSNIQ